MTLGYITADLNNGYSFALWRGIKDSCERKNIHVLFFSAGEYKSPQVGHFMKNVVLDFIKKDLVDGLIVNVATLFHYVDEDEIAAFYREYSGLPIVNIGFEIEDYPTVLVDNKKGVSDGVAHLIHDHAHKKMAFIKGPGYNIESSLRYDAYIETLEKHGITPNPDLVEAGDFSRESGAKCFEKLWKENAPLDAIVASNDEMAIGALRKAQEMGIAVPDETAIIGFDDIPEAARSSIPLTTVRQPLGIQAQKAVEMVADLIEGRQPPRRVMLPAELVVRKSCGCFSARVLSAGLTPPRREKSPGKKGAGNEYDRVLDRVKRAIRVHEGGKSPCWAETLVRAFFDYIEKDNGDAFLPVIDNELNKGIVEGSFDIDSWQDAVSELIKATFLSMNDDATRVKAESFWQMARVLIQETETNAKSHERARSDAGSETRRRINSELISSFDLTRLIHTMSEGLPLLGVDACYMSIFENGGGGSGYPEYSRLILGFNGGIREEIPERGIRFRTRDLVPDGLKSFNGLDNFIVESLFFQRELFGIMLIRADPWKIRLEALRQQISGTLKGALLVREVSDKEEKLKTLLEEQKQRSEELENAYKALKENQEKMLIIEKMASLGRMTAGIAHEMNTPLAAVRNVLVEMDSLVKEYAQSIGDPEIGAEDLREIAGDMAKSLSVGKRAAERAASFIQSVKSQTSGLSAQDRRLFDAVPVIQDAILLMSYALRKNNCPANFSSVEEKVQLFGSGARLSQVIVNLLTNAIDAYKGKGGGTISISIMHEKNGVDVTVSDRGSGIEKGIMSKIFDPLFTTKPFSEGTGLGLTIVQDIVTGEFGGTIEVESEAGVGTSFILHLPKPPRGAANA